MGRRGRRRGPYRVGADEDAPAGIVTARSRAIDATLNRLEGDARVRAAALVGSTFGLDPVIILAEPDELRRLVRLAAHNIVQHEDAKAAKAK